MKNEAKDALFRSCLLKRRSSHARDFMNLRAQFFPARPGTYQKMEYACASVNSFPSTRFWRWKSSWGNDGICFPVVLCGHSSSKSPLRKSGYCSQQKTNPNCGRGKTSYRACSVRKHETSLGGTMQTAFRTWTGTKRPDQYKIESSGVTCKSSNQTSPASSIRMRISA